jgi:hypothetical protein
MIDHKQIESQIAGPLSAALITVATISLTLMGIVLQRQPPQPYLDNLLMVVGILSLVSAARIIDKELDKGGLGFRARVSFGGGGYVLFCIVLATIIAGVMVFNAKVGKTYVPFCATAAGVTSFCIFFLLMTNEHSGWWVFGALSGFTVFSLTPRLAPWLIHLLGCIA